MTPDQLIDWLKLSATLPAAAAAYKLPAGYRWMKARLTNAIAGALLSQIIPTLQAMQSEIGEVRKQVFPNGGGSMNDKLTRVLESTARTERHVGVLQGAMRAHQDADLTQARFEADAEGHFTWTSYALLRWCSRSLEQVVGYGWTNCLSFADRERVRDEWEQAIEEQREFNLRFNMRDAAGVEFPVEAFAKPIRHGSPQIEQWVGVITRACAPT